MDKNTLKQILLELQEQNRHLHQEYISLTTSNNNLYRLIYQIKETPHKAEELSARLDAKLTDIIHVSDKVSETYALNAQKIQELQALLHEVLARDLHNRKYTLCLLLTI